MYLRLRPFSTVNSGKSGEEVTGRTGIPSDDTTTTPLLNTEVVTSNGFHERSSFPCLLKNSPEPINSFKIHKESTPIYLIIQLRHSEVSPSDN